MAKKEVIRNLGIIAHIDHGKTTLADTLLAGAGLLSPAMAGTARVLDYLEEEQKRKITIKTANISLLYKTSSNDYLINLVDTPGHVDFTGKVTRALRVIDGAVVVVDAVEEIMAQTEILVRQALEERVHPVLFINKVDRLITELKLSSQQIEEKFNRIIGKFNDLVEVYAESQFRDKWKAKPDWGSVVFGSALHRWGFTLKTAQEQKMKFSEIITAYENQEIGKLQKNLPLHNAIFNMVVEYVPNPSQAQKYRLERIWSGDLSGKVGQAMIGCDDNGPVVVCVTNVQIEPDGTIATIGRLFSGTVRIGEIVFLVNSEVESSVDQVSVNMGSFRENVDQVPAGNMVTLMGLGSSVRAGETIVDSAFKDSVPFERIKYVSDPVITVAVEPKNPVDLPMLKKALDSLVVEDPNLSAIVSEETGEYLLSGMGELHLEVSVKRLRDFLGGVGIVTSTPRVSYRETMRKNGTVVLAKSPDKQSSFTVQAKPLDENTLKLIDQDKRAKVIDGMLAIDDYSNLLVDSTGQKELPEVLAYVVGGFKFACKAGPLCGEPLRGVQVSLNKIDLGNRSLLNPDEVMRGAGKAVFGSFLTGKPILLEPVYKTIISTSTELAGTCTRILNTRSAKINTFEKKGLLTVISGYIPVAKTFGLSDELRSATSGRAFWQSIFDHWEPVPEKDLAKLIAQVRQRKGLPMQVPKPERFLG